MDETEESGLQDVEIRHAAKVGGEALAEKMKELGLSYADVAVPCEVTKTSVLKWAHGRLRPARDKRLKLKELLGLDPNLWETETERKREAWLKKVATPGTTSPDATSSAQSQPPPQQQPPPSPPPASPSPRKARTKLTAAAAKKRSRRAS